MDNEITASIVGSLISGAFSIVVAWVGKARASSERSGKTSRPAYQIPPRHSGAWRFMLCALIIWFLISPFALGWKLAAINLFATIPITLLAAVARPVRPATANATVLLLYSVHFLLVAFWLATRHPLRLSSTPASGAEPPRRNPAHRRCSGRSPRRSMPGEH